MNSLTAALATISSLTMAIAAPTQYPAAAAPVGGGAAQVETSRGGSSSVKVLPGEDWIAYESNFPYKIRLVRPDGSDDHALDDITVGPEDNPDWSPDGRWLTFVGQGSDATSAPGLWVIDANGHGLRRIVDCSDPCQYLDDPSWSPDGKSIAYSRQAPDAAHGGSLEIADVSTGRTRTVLTAPVGEFTAGVRWSPDGRSMVFEWVKASPTNYDDVTGVTLTRVDIDGPTPEITSLTTDPTLFPELPDWSPSGKYIVFAELATGDAQGDDLFLIKPDGTGLTRLTTLPDWGGSHSDFTNDSAGIYFVAFTAQGLKLCLLNIATRTVSTVGDRVVVGFHPRTRPGR